MSRAHENAKRAVFIDRDGEALIRETVFDAVYYRPHHPEGSVTEFARDCECQKPKPGLIMQALHDYDIIREGSFMVGDRASDILLGKNAGLRTVLLESGYGTSRLEKPVNPDYTFKVLRDFVRIL